GSAVDSQGTLTIKNSDFVQNAGAFTLFAELGSTMTIQNSTVNNNGGEGVEAAGNVTMQNDTISGNRNFGGFPDGGVGTGHHTIIAGNTSVGAAHDCSSPIPNSVRSLDQDILNSCGVSVHANPLLQTVATNGGSTLSQALGAGSPAINAGDNATCLTIDQRYAPRALTAADACDIGAFEVQPQLNTTSIATALSSGSVAVGGSVHDTATLSGATAGAGGTVTYAVYTNNSCSALAAGLQPVPAMVTVTGGVVPDSAAVSFPGAGTFFWQAVYSGDANNGAATSACASEQLTVGKASPSIATSLSPGSISVGGSAHDSATLSGATAAAGGTVSYTVFTTSACSTQAPAAQQPVPATVTVTGGLVPDSAPVSFPGAGTFFWQAAYSGDANNNASAGERGGGPHTGGLAGAGERDGRSSGPGAAGGW